MSPILAAFLRSTALPAAVAAALLLLAGGGKDPLKARLQAAILALAYFAGAYLLLDRFSFPPHQASDTIVLSAMLLAVFVAVSPKDVGSRYAMRAVFVVLLGVTLLWNLRAQLNSVGHYRNMLAFFCLGLGVWSIVERSARQVSLPALILLPLISATAVSFKLLFSASASFSQMAGILCGLLGASLVIALIKPARLSAYALLPFVSVFVIQFMAAGHFYLDANPWHFVYLCWPFVLLWVRTWLPVPKNPIAESAILGVLAAAPLGYLVWTWFKTAGPLY